MTLYKGRKKSRHINKISDYITDVIEWDFENVSQVTIKTKKIDIFKVNFEAVFTSCDTVYNMIGSYNPIKHEFYHTIIEQLSLLPKGD